MDCGSLQVQEERDTVGILLHIGGSVSNLTECNSEHLFDMRITVKRVLGKSFYSNQGAKINLHFYLGSGIICLIEGVFNIGVLKFSKIKATLPDDLTSTPPPQEPCKCYSDQ